MSNRRMSLSEEGKEILDRLADSLEIERPMAVKVALAKGLSISNGPILEDFPDGKNKWVIPDGIIKDKEFLLFKHLIINEVNNPLDDSDLHKHMLLYIEKGLRILKIELTNKTSMEDPRLAIL
ncbi:hypothetical protein WQ57_05510 [Mesobacillus campisalis]|uniref:Uncharacterized protein n=1 Tax=Mesobacillus campisalis TaxID=1408103 RepID=A0A0M2T326_9BACI|nr:DndE family protein [Mesobacillus campisalis]KKK39220.1 hypothetical protein WQ57_05510 [Mesobacillus campisalis]